MKEIDIPKRCEECKFCLRQGTNDYGSFGECLLQKNKRVCYLIFIVTNTECLIISEKGGIYKRPKSIVNTWTIRNDISIDEFTERIFNNL